MTEASLEEPRYLTYTQSPLHLPNARMIGLLPAWLPVLCKVRTHPAVRLPAIKLSWSLWCRVEPPSGVLWGQCTPLPSCRSCENLGRGLLAAVALAPGPEKLNVGSCAQLQQASCLLFSLLAGCFPMYSVFSFCWCPSTSQC